MANSRTTMAPAFREARILREATDENGRYDAAKIAHLLDWTVSDIARYLGRDASTISRFGSSPVHQEKLASLASLIQEVFEIMREDLRATRVWFRTHRAYRCVARRGDSSASVPPTAQHVLSSSSARVRLGSFRKGQTDCWWAFQYCRRREGTLSGR